MDCLNAAIFIAIQCHVAGIAMGGTGLAKSAFFEKLAEVMTLDFVPIIPSQHMPEDIGGMPWLDIKKKVAEIVPMDIILRLCDHPCMLFVDELTTSTRQMRPVLLSAINERRVGSHKFHKDTIVVCAANPPDWACNGSPLEPAMNNRLYHHEWATPFDTWFEGMTHDGNFTVPNDFPIVGDTKAYTAKWQSIIAHLLMKHPEIRECKRIPEGTAAFPSLRSWTNLSQCLAGADKVKASAEVMMELATGLVGEDAAGIFIEYYHKKDLHDAESVLDGTEVVDFENERVDRLIYLPVQILEAITRDPSKQRLDAAYSVLLDMGEKFSVDCVGEIIAKLSAKYCEPAGTYKLPKKLSARWGKLARQIVRVA